MLKKRVVYSVILLLLFSIKSYAVEKADWINVSQEVVSLLVINHELENQSFDNEEAKAELEAFWNESSKEEIDQTYKELKKSIRLLKETNEQLIKAAAEYEKKPLAEKTFIEIEKDYGDMNDTFRNSFSSKRLLKSIFKSDPYYSHKMNVASRLNKVDSFEDKTTVYIQAIDELKIIKQQLDNISHEDAIEIKNIDQYTEDVRDNSIELERLKKEIEPVIAELKTLDKKVNNFIDDAYLNCNAAPVDFSCHSRCEITKIDPIFGTYKTDYDYNCINRCENQESNAQSSLDDEVTDCINDKQYAIDKIERLEEQRAPLISRGKRIEQSIKKHEQDLNNSVNNGRKAIQIYDQLRTDSVNEISASLVNVM